MKRLLSITLLLFFSSVFLVGQNVKFIAPLDGELKLSGNFAELRSTHFHAGIDISTNGKIGLPVKCVADGYVSRVAVSPYGYGHVIYITHDNGYTSVYGHLNEFAKNVSDWVKKEQYKREEFRVNLFPPKDLFQFKQGEIIAFSGNSGSSGGPHLHFELRETKSEHPVNPLLFNFDVKDDIRPKVEHLYVYAQNENSSVSGGYAKQSFPLVFYDGKYHLKGRSSIGANGLIGLGVDAIDYLTGSWSKCGVFAINVYVDDSLYYSMKLNELDYAVARSFQSYIDFEEKVKRNKRVHQCFVEPGNQLGIYGQLKNEGKFEIAPKQTRNIKIEMIDVYGLKSELAFKMVGLANHHRALEEYTSLFKYNEDNEFKTKNAQIEITNGSLYKDLRFQFSDEPKLEGTYSDLYKFHNPTVPLDKSIELKIKLENLPIELENKALLAIVSSRGSKSAVDGTFKNGWVEAKVRSFGNYCVVVDTISPIIKSLSITSTGKLTNQQSIRFVVRDEFSGIKEYKGLIDGKWVLFEYDAKKDLVFYNFDEHIETGRTHTLIFTVEDLKGNLSKYETSFYK